MNGQLYTVDQVAGLLGLHVKTVRGYVRDGKLKGTRVGKGYRITAQDLATFTGQPLATRESVGRTRRTETTTIVQVDAASPDLAHRLTTVLGAAVMAPPEDDGALHVETVYDEERATLKIILLGGLERVASALRIVAALVEERR